jgi:gliding motility-associated-like protein
MIKKILVISFVFSILGVCAQLVTSTAQPPGALVQNVLLGPGVTVSNISYTGSPGAIGFFDGTNTNLGIAQGIVMTTGTVLNNGSGPHGPNNSANSGIDNGVGGSGLLGAVVGATTFNAATLEFDFIPYSDTVRFRYVFGSEEYPEYAPPNNSSFNDVFGFFISGPGIAGLQNIAQVPGGGGVVSINNVNAITNAAYFTNNGDGNTAPQNGSPFYIQYDGFTKVLEAVARVQCGQTYHLILAIADVGDGIYDSGIFLEANSLSSNTPVTATYTLSQQTDPDPTVMSEGCVSATVRLQRSGNIAQALSVPITVGGTATNGVDYTNIPNSITFPAGQNIVEFTIDAFADGIAEGLETIIIQFTITDACGNVSQLPLTLRIKDVQPVGVTIDNPGVQCPGDEVILTAIPTGGAPPYTYLWSNGATTPTISVSPNLTQNFTVTVTDNCLNESASNTTTVTVPVFEPLSLTTSGNITEICPYITHPLSATAVGGGGIYAYQWTTSAGQVLGSGSGQNVTPSQTTNYVVTVTDQCGNMTSATILYTITSPPLVISVSPSVEICPGDSTLLTVSATGGFGQYYYLWPASGETTASIWVNPFVSTNYQVIVSDECQTFTVNGSTSVLVVKPTANFQVSSHTWFDDLPITFMNTSQNAVDYFWSFGDGNTSTLVHPNNTYDDPGLYYVTLIAYDEKGCTDTIVKPMPIEEAYYVYVPNSFTPDGFRHNNTFSASFYGVHSAKTRVFNRWGQLIFESDDLNFKWDGTYKGVMSPDGTYTWRIDYVSNSGREIMITGHVNVLK